MTPAGGACVDAHDRGEPHLLARVAAGLRRAQQQVLHGAACSCCSRGPVHLDQRMMDADLLGYLSSRYRAGGETMLLATVEAWLADSRTGLLARLGGAGQTGRGDDPATAGLRARILRDVLAVLEPDERGTLETVGMP